MPSRKGGKCFGKPKHKISGIDRFFVYDPDGNRIEIQGADGSGEKPFGMD